jgi:SAM-dependent methyltransferase
MIGVLHHFDDIPATLQHIATLVRPGGWIVANEPQPGNRLVQAARCLRKSIDRTYSGDQITLGRDDLQTLYRDAGLIDIRIKPQGVFSTPFAEVVLPPQPVTSVLAKAACHVDHALETTVLSEYLRGVSWNLIAAGQKP